MKHQGFMGFLFAFICSGMMTLAQDPHLRDRQEQKPQLFASLPPKTACNLLDLEKISNFLKSEQVSIKLNDNLTLSGEVIEKVESAGIQNVNIRLSNFGNALLNISITSQPDRTNRIIGRIIHPKHADALVIAEENGKYYVTKYKMEFFMVE